MLACVLSGAALLDLAFGFRIDTDLESLVAVDSAATGNAALDRVLARIASRGEVCDTSMWIGILSAEEAPAILESALAELERGGLLRERKGTFSWRRGRLRPDGEALDASRPRIAQLRKMELIGRKLLLEISIG